MTISEKKVAELNAMEATIREWQRGAITQREMSARLGDHLTQEQIDALVPRVYRTIDRGSLAKLIAKTIGL